MNLASPSYNATHCRIHYAHFRHLFPGHHGSKQLLCKFHPYKRAVCSMRSVFFSRAFPGHGYSYLFSMRMKKKNLRLQPIKRRVSLAWKPNWLPYHHVLKLWLTGLTPGQALDQRCHRIQTSKKIFCQRKTWRVRPSSKCHQSLGRNGWSSLRGPFKGLWGLRS